MGSAASMLILSALRNGCQPGHPARSVVVFLMQSCKTTNSFLLVTFLPLIVGVLGKKKEVTMVRAETASQKRSSSSCSFTPRCFPGVCIQTRLGLAWMSQTPFWVVVLFLFFLQAAFDCEISRQKIARVLERGSRESVVGVQTRRDSRTESAPNAARRWLFSSPCFGCFFLPLRTHRSILFCSCSFFRHGQVSSYSCTHPPSESSTQF